LYLTGSLLSRLRIRLSASQGRWTVKNRGSLKGVHRGFGRAMPVISRYILHCAV